MPSSIFSCQTTLRRPNVWNSVLKCQPGNLGGCINVFMQPLSVPVVLELFSLRRLRKSFAELATNVLFIDEIRIYKNLLKTCMKVLFIDEIAKRNMHH